MTTPETPASVTVDVLEGCPECGDFENGPMLRCSGCGAIACDGCIHHGLHLDANGELMDMSGTYYAPDLHDEEDEATP